MALTLTPLTGTANVLRLPFPFDLAFTMRVHRLLVVLLLLLAACGGDVEAPSDAPEAPPSSTRGTDPDVVPVAPERMQALLPDELVGRSRSDLSGSVRGALGVSTSVVQASYGSADSLVTVTLTDVGGLGSPTMLGYHWVGEEIDRAGESSTERTLQIGGYPAYERTERRGPDAVHVFVGDRIVVEVRSEEMALPALRRALGQLPLDRLAALPQAEE